jgi:predicted phage baseplate assembly protein
MPAGVRADIKVTVDGQIWQQVASLRDSSPTDAHYIVRMNEAGDIRIQFGDGLEHGRRLPTGDNNIRVSCRVGSGLAGNVPAGGLETPVKPHKLVKSLRQPMPASGGDDMEGVESLRTNAPASLLTLERAVSLEDFANLAVSQSGIWQANAFTGANAMGRQESVQVVIVPAGGAELDEQLNTVVPEYVLEKQREFLLYHALPGVAVTVTPFEPVLVNMSITVRVKSAEYDPEQIKQAVRQALKSAFSLEDRHLGQPLYRSELYKVVEAVKGVENSTCVLSFADRPGLEKPMIERPRAVNWEIVGDKQIVRHIQPRDWQVVYVDTDYSTVNITTAEFEL